MHSLGIVQWNSTRRDHPGNLGGVFGSGPVKRRYNIYKSPVFEQARGSTGQEVS